MAPPHPVTSQRGSTPAPCCPSPRGSTPLPAARRGRAVGAGKLPCASRCSLFSARAHAPPRPLAHGRAAPSCVDWSLLTSSPPSVCHDGAVVASRGQRGCPGRFRRRPSCALARAAPRPFSARAPQLPRRVTVALQLGHVCTAGQWRRVGTERCMVCVGWVARLSSTPVGVRHSCRGSVVHLRNWHLTEHLLYAKNDCTRGQSDDSGSRPRQSRCAPKKRGGRSYGAIHAAAAA